MALCPGAAGGLGRKQAVLTAQLRHARGRASACARRAFGCSARTVIAGPTGAVCRAAALGLDASGAAVSEARVRVALAGAVAHVAALPEPALSIGDALDAALLPGAYARRARGARASGPASEVIARKAIAALPDTRALGCKARSPPIAQGACVAAAGLAPPDGCARLVGAAVRARAAVGVGRALHAQAHAVVALGQVRRALRRGAASVLSIEDALPVAAVALRHAVAARGAAARAGIADVAGATAAAAFVGGCALARPVEALFALQASRARLLPRRAACCTQREGWVLALTHRVALLPGGAAIGEAADPVVLPRAAQALFALTGAALVVARAGLGLR